MTQSFYQIPDYDKNKEEAKKAAKKVDLTLAQWVRKLIRDELARKRRK
jgi:hypothetical protein